MTPASAPSYFLDPSKYIVQAFDWSRTDGRCASIHYVVKSGRTCALIALGCAYFRSHGPNSLNHLVTRPVASGLVSMSEIADELTTVIGCPEK